MSENLKSNIDGTQTIDFKGLYDKAMQTDFNEQPSEQQESTSVEAVSEQTEQPLEQAHTQEKPAQGVDAEGVLALPDDAKIRAKIDGKEEVISVKEYRDALQREASWTRKQQLFANQRKEAETEIAGMFAQLQQQAKVLELAKQQFQQANPIQQLVQALEQKKEVEVDPNQIATIGEVQSALKTMQDQHLQLLQQKEQEAQHRIQEAQQQVFATLKQQTDAQKFTHALEQEFSLEDSKLLTDLNPYAREIVRFQVAQMPAKDIDEAITQMRTFVKEWVDNTKTKFTVSQQQVEVEKAKTRMETSKGSAPSPGQGQKKEEFFNLKTGKLDWNALNKKAMSILEQ